MKVGRQRKSSPTSPFCSTSVRSLLERSPWVKTQELASSRNRGSEGLGRRHL